ncbi:MAG: heat-inducible transcriptional repressor HrcA [Oscillospiraceae bacterium]|jgi:heat-inducible transcriptional repressor|nr:heat-inducible transcription repressor HrcA [Bacillota bacterium]
MELTERKKQILRAIVDSYIRTAEPVGSKTISQLPGMDFSPATIRNEMADLTSMGLLEQPHTSAGRVPSAAGYRLYVDELMQDYRLSMDETKTINQAMEVKMQEVDKMISQVGKLVSKMTDLPAYAVAARSSQRTVKRFDLILAEAGSFILVVMLSDNQVQNKLIRLPLDVSQEDLRLLSAVLNASLTELTADEITPELLAKVTRSAAGAASLVPVIVDYTVELLKKTHSEVYMTGQAKLLGQPEYHDVEKAQEVLTSLDEDVISNLPATLSSGTTQILVGPENVAKELKDSSVVITKFDIGDGMQGMIGVVGPTRMDYAKITARLSYFAENLGRMFAKPQQPALNEPELPEEPKK